MMINRAPISKLVAVMTMAIAKAYCSQISYHFMQSLAAAFQNFIKTLLLSADEPPEKERQCRKHGDICKRSHRLIEQIIDSRPRINMN